LNSTSQFSKNVKNVNFYDYKKIGKQEDDGNTFTIIIIRLTRLVHPTPMRAQLGQSARSWSHNRFSITCVYSKNQSGA